MKEKIRLYGKYLQGMGDDLQVELTLPSLLEQLREQGYSVELPAPHRIAPKPECEHEWESYNTFEDTIHCKKCNKVEFNYKCEIELPEPPKSIEELADEPICSWQEACSILGGKINELIRAVNAKEGGK